MSTITRTDSKTSTEITIHYELIGKGKSAIVFYLPSHGDASFPSSFLLLHPR